MAYFPGQPQKSDSSPLAVPQTIIDSEDPARPLAPSVYNLFDQVFNAREPPDLDLEYLRDQCLRTEWRENLYFDCDLMAGGLTTLMSQLKTCIHMTIETGANLIIPTSPLRRLDDLLLWDDEHRVPLGQCFDREFFIDRLTRACPQMTISRLQLPNLVPDVPISHTISMNFSEAPFDWGVGPYATTETPWRQWFLDTVEQDTAQLSEGSNVALRVLTLSQFFDVTDPKDNQQLRWLELSHLMRAHELPRLLISTLLDSMKDSAGKHQPFFGVHFRVEGDVVSDPFWSSLDTQIDRVWDTVEAARDLYDYDDSVEKIIYLACGDIEQIEKFKSKAELKGWKVIDKYSVARSLGPDVVQQLNDMNFDREAMIDFGVLIMSDFFVGLGASAFSFTIAHDRSPTGRYLGSSLDPEVLLNVPAAYQARTHLYPDGGFAYQCCL